MAANRDRSPTEPPPRRRVAGLPLPRRAESGQGVVELALVVSLVPILLFVSFDLGRAFHAWMTVSHAARDVARVASDPTATDAMIDTAFTEAREPLKSGGYGIVPDCRCGASITVTVTYVFDPIVPLPGGKIVIERQATARMDPLA